MSEDESKPIFRQMIEALIVRSLLYRILQSLHLSQYLKKQSIIHRDIKCENIFLDSNDNVKLGDFGFARILKENEVVSGLKK